MFMEVSAKTGQNVNNVRNKHSNLLRCSIANNSSIASFAKFTPLYDNTCSALVFLLIGISGAGFKNQRYKRRSYPYGWS